LRDAKQPVTTRELTDRIMRSKTMTVADQRSRDLIQRTILSSLSRLSRTLINDRAYRAF
jgi:hypothetical protein